MVETKSNASNKSIETLGLAGYLGSDRYLRRYVGKLVAADIETVGDIAKLSSKVLFRRFPTTPKNRQKIVAHLRVIGVSL